MGDEADYLEDGEDYYYAYNDDEDEEVDYKYTIDYARPSSRKTRKKQSNDTEWSW